MTSVVTSNRPVCIHDRVTSVLVRETVSDASHDVIGRCFCGNTIYAVAVWSSRADMIPAGIGAAVDGLLGKTFDELVSR